jgi:acyl carrier protein
MDGRIMMDRESIRVSLLAYLEDDLGETIPSLDDAIPIREGLGLDSVDVVGLVMQVERQFRIRLATEELATIVTVGDMLDLLEAKIAALTVVNDGTETNSTRDAA